MHQNDYSIRLERPDDYRTVENLTREAFWNLSVPGCDEHYFVHVMRGHADFVPALDFVMEVESQIIGNIMYVKSKLVDETGAEKQILSFGPVCIHPAYQRRGYGKALLEHSFAKAVALRYDTIVIFGNPDNYVARGFKSCKKYNVCLAGDLYPCALLVKELKTNALEQRKWCFHESTVGALCGDVDAVAAFDKQFPPKVKAWQPSQEEFYIHSHSAIAW